MSTAHRERILDQFTRQAVPFSQSQNIRNQQALEKIVRLAEASPKDTVLDVACGPGLLACAFARVVRHAVGIDLTPAMLEQARQVQREYQVENVSWNQGDVLALPYPDRHFSIVATRFSFHHLQQPLAALQEMKRVCRPGGRVIVADMAPAPDKAGSLNTLERLRDPSHVRALTVPELNQLFGDAGMQVTRSDRYRLEGELEDLLQRSFPNQGDEQRIRQMFEDSLGDDALDLATRRENGKIFYSYPVAVLVAEVS